MKKKTILLLLCSFALALSCAGGAKSKGGVIKIGVTPMPHAEIVESVSAAAEELGYTLEIVEFDDYVQPNMALASGDLDANYFQHNLYLNQYNKENQEDLVAAFGIHFEPLGVYSESYTNLSDVPTDGTLTVAVPLDSSNNARALMLLESAGLLSLKDNDNFDITIYDIDENSGLAITSSDQILEIDAPQVPHSLKDVGLAAINANYALEAGLVPSEDALALEKADNDMVDGYTNIVAVRRADLHSEKTEVLRKILQTPAVKDFINTKYNGSVQPVFVDYN